METDNPMDEILQLVEEKLSARQLQLRQAASRMIARTSASTRIGELLESEAGDAVRRLTLRELVEALAELTGRQHPVGRGQSQAAASGRSSVARQLAAELERAIATSHRSEGMDSASESDNEVDGESNRGSSEQERIYRAILEALADGPLTIGQLAKRIDIDTDELRGYLGWMHRKGKVSRSGRARATRYFLGD